MRKNGHSRRINFCLALTAIILLAIFQACQKSEKAFEKNDVEKYGLKGKVKSIRVTNFKAKEYFGINVLKDGRLKDFVSPYGVDSCLYFNEIGQLIKHEWLPFDENDNYLKETNKIDQAEYLTLKEEIVYNNNFIIRKIKTKCDTTIEVDNFVYNGNGKLDSIKICWKRHFGFCGCNDIFYKYSYDSNGFIVSCIMINNKTVMSNNAYICDIKGNIIEDKEYGYDTYSKEWGALLSTKTLIYDENGNLIYVKNKSNKSLTPNDINTYDYGYSKDNKLISERYCTQSEDLDQVYETSYIYDYNNDLISTIYINWNLKKSIETYKYKYDKQNNWILKIVYNNNTPISLIERIIEYYK